MNFEKLRDFITKQMRMSQIYQPVMLIELLQNGGMASRDQIAKAILSHDSSQIEYYEHITLNMVGKVLTNNRGITERNNRDYYLKGFDNLSSTEVQDLIDLCSKKIGSFKEARGEKYGHIEENLLAIFLEHSAMTYSRMQSLDVNFVA